jgi:uncharacterized protein (TIGR03086 family)
VKGTGVTTARVDALAQALDDHEHLVAEVGPQQWTLPTPCTEWSVRDLVNHFVGGNRLYTEILHGDDQALSRRQGRQGRDHLGDHPVSAYRHSADELLEAFRSPGVFEQTFTLPIGTVSGSTALDLRLVETLVHGWDLAQATDQQVKFAAEHAEQALAFSRRKLADYPGGLPVFGSPQKVADDAPAIDQLVALLGRPVTPAATPSHR